MFTLKLDDFTDNFKVLEPPVLPENATLKQIVAHRKVLADIHEHNKSFPIHHRKVEGFCKPCCSCGKSCETIKDPEGKVTGHIPVIMLRVRTNLYCAPCFKEHYRGEEIPRHIPGAGNPTIANPRSQVTYDGSIPNGEW